MGCFDDLTVERALPDGFDPAGVSFQTKDTAEQRLVRYVLREDGTLWNTEANAPEEFHGALEFYTSNWCGSCGTLEMTADDQPPWRAEYTALFDRGKLLRIEGPGWHLAEGVTHVLRADFNRRAQEYRDAGLTAEQIALRDLHTEWVHWMSFQRDHFEAVKAPALAVRLHYLWSNGAWGMYRSDAAQELRNWSAWLSEQADLTPDALDLLNRTKAILPSPSLGEGAEPNSRKGNL